MFQQFTVDIDQAFTQLSQASPLEEVCAGRLGGIVVACDQYHRVPIVRSTTKYKIPAQSFKDIHYQLAEAISQHTNTNFNNAMVEIYTTKYGTMGFHSDQALDLAEDSVIAIFSCYEKPPTEAELRTLHVRNKTSHALSKIRMQDNSVIAFSTKTNRQHLHKIILESFEGNNRWLGVTLRLSKRFVTFVDGIPYIDDTILRLSTDPTNNKEFYKLRSRENKEVDFTYPELDYTISESNLMPVVSDNHLHSN